MAGGSRSSQQTVLTVSPGSVEWLRRHDVSLAFTSYHSGQLFLAGVHPNGTMSIHQQSFGRATGLCWQQGRLWIATDRAIYRLEDTFAPGASAADVFDACLVPRTAFFTGDIATGELAADSDGRLVFVAARYGCLGIPDERHAFRRRWRPPSADGWHLTGLAMANDGTAYVTAFASGDEGAAARGGVLYDVATSQVVVEGLSLPHSPRVCGDALFVIESGRGRLLSYDLASGEGRQVALLPGFARGLALYDGFALVTLSRSYEAASLDEELARRGVEPWCGIVIIDIASGDAVEWIRLDGAVAEMFDIVVLPGVTCPSAIGPFTNEQLETITVADGSDR